MPAVLSKPLPELCLLAIFQQMSLNDRLNAYHVCPRWSRLVREVCRKDVRSLTIVLSDGRNGSDADPSLREIEEHINQNCMSSSSSESHLVSSPSSTLMSPSNGSPSQRLTKCNCLKITLKLWNSAGLAKILFIFPAITEVTFLNRCHKSNNKKVYRNLLKLVKMLFEEGRLPLTAFKIIDRQNRHSRSEYLLFCLLYQHAEKLKHLTILNDVLQWSTDQNSQRRVSLFGHVSKLGSFYFSNLDIFRMCHPVFTLAINLTLQVEWLKRKQDQLQVLGRTYTPHTVSLVAQFSSERCFHFRYTKYQPAIRMPSIFLMLSHSVTSITLNILPSSCQNVFLLIGITALPRLTHLGVKTDFSLCTPAEFEHLPPIRVHPIERVVFLELQLTITQHRQIRWLNLPHILPALKVIRLVSLECMSCDVKTTCFANADYLTPTKRVQASKCLRKVIRYLHQTRVPLDQILFEGEEHLGSSERLLQR